MVAPTVIETLSAEETDLKLHTELCHQRYVQLIHKFDEVDSRLDKIEAVLLDIKDSIDKRSTDNTEKYLRWGGSIIGIMATALVGMLLHILSK